MKEVNVKAPKRINLAEPVTVGEILYKKVFGMGKQKTKGLIKEKRWVTVVSLTQ